MKKGLTSTILISILVVINLFLFFSIFINVDPSDLQVNGSSEEMGEMVMLEMLVVGGVLAVIYGWMLLIALTHAICLIFTIRNRHADAKAIRCINVVLDVCNALLIVGPILKIWVF